ncbi:MAG: hypothetical protein KKE39_02780 [Bacteroidetes bacterium]|nr:hypothetical protein [Bacteroidota bacterium]MBU1373614.1 hypothetical protein [Bacteroidota bacterium]MBU1484779.1 hypothetical protein [Bacteroidota bacterium]MBU1760647.1 hypothetical protein [Bacteroidota bacterium]MBU2045979.1 hypothetical protein [Bacteroidota bacterium]
MKLLVTIILFTLQITNLKAYDIKQIRADYVSAINDSEKADQLCNHLENIKNPDPLILAYLGSAQAIKAKHAWNPVSKLSYIKKGFSTINEAVSKAPENLEVRFLRFSLSFYVPSFLGYSKNLTIDKNKIIDLLSKQSLIKLDVDKTILKNMVYFMIDSKLCSTQEIAVLKRVPTA